ncbi:phosphatase PAP2 family protein [Methylopila musalis]|uniref:Phosphatase PAP2 family protein n=1 Tax=Methylopila musalis TaxID=1134781 RepID=A0ABW3Z4J5_9HYPH
MRLAPRRPALRLAGLLLAAHGAMLATLAFGKITLDLDDVKQIYGLLFILGVLAAGLGAAGFPRFALGLAAPVACLLLAPPVAVWSYQAMGAGFPLADDRLVAMDAALGFDWRSFIAFVDGRPALAFALDLAYRSFTPQLLLLPMIFALRGDAAHACAIIAAYALLCFSAAVIGAFFPALGTYVVYGVAQSDLTSIDAHYGFFFLPEFNAVREPGPFLLDFDKAAGILTFPSVHAGAATLCAWAAWRSPVLRWPFLILNVFMATAAVSHANHYLIDVAAGVALAAACAWLATMLFRASEQGLGAMRPALRPHPTQGEGAADVSA